MRLPARQIDRLVARQTGSGSATSAEFRLPRALYTVYVHYDPPAAVRSLELVHDADGAVPKGNTADAVPVGEMSAPIVQQELPAGRYRVEVGTLTPTCSWDVQVVLNRMLSWRRPPQGWCPSVAPPEPITVRSEDSPVFYLSQTGRYDAHWTVGPGRTDRTIGQHSLDLRAADGHAVHLGGGSATRAYRRNPHFLGAGQWTVEMNTDLEWELVITPVIGATGGGSREF